MLFMAGALFATSSLFAQNPGDLDPTFGTDGKVITPIGDDSFVVDVIQNVTVQPDGKIIAVGSSREGSNKRFTFARYNPDGTFDNTFGDNGLVILPDNGVYGNFVTVAKVLSDSKIVASGRVYNPNAAVSSYPVLFRLNADGSMDNSFGNGGMVEGDFGNHDVLLECMQLQSDGKFVLAGYYDNVTAAVRYNADGTIDQSYGTNGVCVVSSIQGTSYAKGIAIQNDGKAVLAGFYANGGSNKWFITRINTDGTLDNTFGDNGVVLMSIGEGQDFCQTVEIQPDGKILAGGQTWIENDPELQYDFVIARLNPNGTLDPTFGSDGLFVHRAEPGGQNYINDIVIASESNNIYAAYTTAKESDARFNMGVLCLTPNGQLKETFGEQGYSTISLGDEDGTHNALSMAMQPDGKVILTGEVYASAFGGYPFAMARFITGETSGPSGIISNEESSISLYPNPVTENLYISCENEHFTVQLFEVASGRLVMSENDARTINVSNLPAGTYIVKLVSDGKVLVDKFIKL